MLRWYNLLLLAALVILIALFAVANQSEVVLSIPGGFPMGPSQVRLPVFGLVFGPLFLGFFLGVFFCWLNARNSQHRCDELLRTNLALREEVTNLRNLPLESDTGF
ncbi:MAG: hypothetical protein HQL54_09615 [Magnetococcales bacterium]|nr:hypothetical protein [Magnetococcales bacterium]